MSLTLIQRGAPRRQADGVVEVGWGGVRTLLAQKSGSLSIESLAPKRLQRRRTNRHTAQHAIKAKMLPATRPMNMSAADVSRLSTSSVGITAGGDGKMLSSCTHACELSGVTAYCVQGVSPPGVSRRLNNALQASEFKTFWDAVNDFELHARETTSTAFKDSVACQCMPAPHNAACKRARNLSCLSRKRAACWVQV